MLREELGGAADWEQRFDIAEAFVMRKLGEAVAPSPEIAWAFEKIAATGGRAKVGLDRPRDRLEPKTPGAAFRRRDRARAEIGVAHRPAEPRDGGGESRR